ncbi:MAG: hypothetical protein WC430_00670 [Patescibacteria group bacterium]
MTEKVFLKDHKGEEKNNDVASLRREIKKLSEEIFKKKSSIYAEENRRTGAIFQKISELKSLLEQAEMDNFLKRRR